jgi:hypothetical protein
LSKCAIFSLYTFFIFCIWSLEKSVEVTTTVYVLVDGVGMALKEVLISKSEDNDGMKSKEGNG